MIRAIFVLCSLLLSGCLVTPGASTPAHFRLSRLEGTRVLTLTEPQSVVLKAGNKPLLLARGTYRAYFADPGGTYYEAPFSQNPEVHFSGSRRGGLYVIRSTDGPRIYLYYQQNQMSATYVHGAGMLTMGGDNTFTIGDQLPAEFTELLANQTEL